MGCDVVGWGSGMGHRVFVIFVQGCLGCKHGRLTGCFCHVSNLEGLHFAEKVVLMEGRFLEVELFSQIGTTSQQHFELIV